MPDFLISLKLVLSPIAASAATIKNLLVFFAAAEMPDGIIPKLLTIANAKNPKINHGKIFDMFTFL